MAFDWEPFPLYAVRSVALAHRVRQAAHYTAAMGLWHPPSMQGIHGPLPSSSCNACMSAQATQYSAESGVRRGYLQCI